MVVIAKPCSRSALLAFLLACGCQDPTQVRLHVKTDIPFQQERLLAITASSQSSQDALEPNVLVAHPWEAKGNIGTLVLVPKIDSNGPVNVRVVLGVTRDPSTCSAKDADGCVIARRKLSFVKSRTVELPVGLHAVCEGVGCDEDSTCNALGECVPSEIDPEQCKDLGDPGCFPIGDRLPTGTGSLVDGGPMDGGLDVPEVGPDGPQGEPPALDTVDSIAGTGEKGGEDGPLAQASFSWPWGLDVDNDGRIFIADYDTNSIRMIANGQVTTFAGDGTGGFVDGPAASARFRLPHDVALRGGEVIVADHTNHRLRVIVDGQVSTLAGSTNGYADGPGTEALLSYPYGVAVGPEGQVYVTDAGNHRIRVVDKSGVVSTLAGEGSAGHADGPAAKARFYHPQYVAVDASGRVFVSDLGCSCIRLIDNGVVTTFAGVPQVAGMADGPVNQARFDGPAGLDFDPWGRLFVADAYNHRIRMIHEGVVTTVAGNGSEGYTDGPATSSSFWGPIDVASGPDGRIYVADMRNNRIRVLQP